MSVKIVFASNFFNHHQKPLCDALYGMIGEDFHFIETEPISKERLDMGWGMEAKPAYVRQNYTDDASAGECQMLIDEADAVIHGNAPLDLLRNRRKKLTFIYTERIYKAGCSWARLAWHLVMNGKRGYRARNTYLLCAGAYVAGDFARSLTFLGKAYRWGYFPELKEYDLDALFEQKRAKERVSILWAGRFLEWKHPEIPVLIAEKLKREGYEFDLNMIGGGALEEQLRSMIGQKRLEDCVHMLGTMPPESVRAHMENADIFLFTSDFNEGWGTVLNESMNSGCAVVASHAAGSVPFLVTDGDNGFIYRNGDPDGAYERVVQLVRQPQPREKMGRKAFHTIAANWNAGAAAGRFLVMADALLRNESADIFAEGPCSRAGILVNGWYGNGKNQ